MRALIIGAGAGGTTIASSLARSGWRASIFEAYSHSSGLSQGEFLTVAVNGQSALRTLCARDVIRKNGFPTPLAEFYSEGRKVGTMPLGPKLEDGSVTHTVRRPHLYKGLYDVAIENGAEITHLKKLVSFNEDTDGVTATFEDGSQERGDVLIAADGIHSPVRQLLDPQTPDPYYIGRGNSAGYSNLDIDAPVGVYRMFQGNKLFFGYTKAPDGSLWWFASPPVPKPLTPNELHDNGNAVKKRLINLLDGDKGPAADIIAASMNEPRIWNQFALKEVPCWHSNRAVIIGDAAHAVSPATGQGASMAFEDAVVLAKVLGDYASVPEALTAYDAERRERIRAILSYGKKPTGERKTGAIGRLIRDFHLP